MPLGKTIKLYLMDSSPNGRIWAELSNWTGKAYKIPRKMVSSCKDIMELSGEGSTGVYLLFGSTDENISYAYIGETEYIYERLSDHVRKKDFWNDAVVIISKDENLNKAHIKYLEHRMVLVAKEVDRFELDNNDTPKKPSISRPDQDEMEEFFKNVKLLVSTLGYKIFDDILNQENIVQHQSESNNGEELFELSDTKGAQAKGLLSPEGFVVLKGAKFIKDTTPTCPINSLSIREQLISEGKLVLEGNYYILQKNHLFSSSSNAASAIKGNSSSGPREWKLKDGTSLRQFESEALK